jgi:hypothetical protein
VHRHECRVAASHAGDIGCRAHSDSGATLGGRVPELL